MLGYETNTVSYMSQSFVLATQKIMGGGALFLAKKSTQGRAGKYLFPLELMVNGPSISGFHVCGVTGHSSGFPS